MKQLQTLWKLWAKALGEKASECNKESDKIAIIRTFILSTYIITNAFIVAGVIRQWDKKQIIQIEIQYPSPSMNTKNEYQSTCT